MLFTFVQTHFSAARATAESTSKRLTSDYEGMKLRLEAEVSNYRSRASELDSELKNYQMELLEKDELLQTSVRLDDFERVKAERETTAQRVKQLEGKLDQVTEQLNDISLRSKEKEEAYLQNIHVSLV